LADKHPLLGGYSVFTSDANPRVTTLCHPGALCFSESGSRD